VTEVNYFDACYEGQLPFYDSLDFDDVINVIDLDVYKKQSHDAESLMSTSLPSTQHRIFIALK
jgi:hypothetical protein